MDKWAIAQKSHNLKEQHAGRTWVEERYFGSQTGLQGQFYIVFGEWVFEGSHRYRHTHKTVNKGEFLFVQNTQLWLVPLVKLLPIIIIIIILSHLFRSNLLCSKVIKGRYKREQAQNIWNILQEIKPYYKQTEYPTTTKMLLRSRWKFWPNILTWIKIESKEGRKKRKENIASMKQDRKAEVKKTERAIEI